jgi:hypothetical protein
MQILVISAKIQHTVPGKIEEDHTLFAFLTRVKGFIDGGADGVGGFWCWKNAFGTRELNRSFKDSPLFHRL